MVMLRKSVFASALAGAAVLGMADAKAQTNWSGTYLGVQAGYAWGGSDLSSVASCPAGNTSNTCFIGNNATTDRLSPIGAAASGSGSPTGFTGGVQAGANWQSGTLVYGVEVDFSSFKLSSSVGGSAPLLAPGVAGFAYTVGAKVDTTWLATARARLGFAVTPSVLAYVTGGLALTTLEVSNSYTDNNVALGGIAGFGASSRSETTLGWTIGGGAEYALSRNMSIKAEYLYVDFDKVGVNGFFMGPVRDKDSLATNADLTAHIARAGINYKF